MAVVNPSSRGNGRKSSRARPDFTPSKIDGFVLAVRLRRRSRQDRRPRERRAVLAQVSLQYRHRQARGRLARLPGQCRERDRRDGSQQSASWCRREGRPEVGCRGPGRDALRDDLRRRRDQGGAALPDPDVDGAPARGAGDVVGCLRRGHQAQGRRHRLRRGRRLGVRHQGRRQEVLPAALQDPGLRQGSRGAVRGRSNNDDADAD